MRLKSLESPPIHNVKLIMKGRICCIICNGKPQLPSLYQGFMCWGPMTTHSLTSPNMCCLHIRLPTLKSVSIVMAWGLLRFLGQNGVAGCKRTAAMPRVLQ
ncbi:unnamed protein product [Prunus armeniaca]